MRVIAGRHKRRRLEAPPGFDVTRPTADRVRESVFNIIAPEIPGAIVVDLFSGSGALGIEALSRGASACVFVDKNPSAISCIRANLAALGETGPNVAVLAVDVAEFLRAPRAILAGSAGAGILAASADVFFADPPYDSAWYDDAFPLLEASGLCRADTLAVVEMAHGRELPAGACPPWEREGERKYGKTRLELWRRGSG